jgi:hypothetical protein
LDVIRWQVECLTLADLLDYLKAFVEAETGKLEFPCCNVVRLGFLVGHAALIDLGIERGGDGIGRGFVRLCRLGGYGGRKEFAGDDLPAQIFDP